MSYCVNCGVELGTSEKACPLCRTLVVHPGVKQKTGDAPYPKGDMPSESRNHTGLIVIFTVLLLLPLSVVILADFSVNRGINWSGYVIGALLILYFSIIPPVVVRNAPPVVFILFDALCVLIYLFYIEKQVSLSWFWQLSFPLVSALAVELGVLITISQRLGIVRLKLIASALFACGFYALLVEWRIYRTFHYSHVQFWSLYPFVVCLLLAVLCLLVDRNKPLKEKLSRKFFL